MNPKSNRRKIENYPFCKASTKDICRAGIQFGIKARIRSYELAANMQMHAPESVD